MSVAHSHESLEILDNQRDKQTLNLNVNQGSVTSVRSESAVGQSRRTRATGYTLNLSPDLVLNITLQYSRVEALESLFHEYELNQDVTVYLEVVDTIQQANEIHEEFSSAHKFLVSKWPASLIEHEYIKSDYQKRNEICITS